MPSVLVTGANKGIGLAIVQGLVEKGYTTFLGSRDMARGVAAKESLGEAAKGMLSRPSVPLRALLICLGTLANPLPIPSSLSLGRPGAGCAAGCV